MEPVEERQQPGVGGSIRSNTGSGRSEKSTDRVAAKRQNVEERLMCRPPREGVPKKTNQIPSFIPHKKLLQEIHTEKIIHEPLSDFLSVRQRLTKPKRRPTEISEVRSGNEADDISSTTEISRQVPFFEIERPHVWANQTELINKMRNAKDGSFIYMTYAVPKSSEHYHPYAFSVVPFSRVDKDNFFTMSAKGVIQQVGPDTIFTPLDKWESDYNIYCKLREFRTFDKFRIWKGFYVWRKFIIFKKMMKARNYIAENLFILDTDLRKGLLSLQLMCNKMYDTIFINDSHIEQFLLFYFIDVQMERLENVKDQLLKFRDIAKEVIVNACHGSLLARGFVAYEMEGELTAKEKRMIKISFIDQASKKKICRRLTSFIILCDYSMINMMHTIIILSTNKLNEVLKRHHDRIPNPEKADIYKEKVPEVVVEEEEKPEELLPVPMPIEEEPEVVVEKPLTPLIIVNVVIESDQLNLDPSVEVTCDIFDQLLTLWQDHTKQMNSFIGDNLFAPFTNPMINLKIEDRICGWGPTLAFYLKEDQYLKKETENIFNYLKTNYTIAHQFVSKLDFIRKFFQEDQKVPEERIENETDTETFRNLCRRYHNEEDTVKNLVDHVEFGILHIHLTKLKETVLPEPKRLIQTLEYTLPLLGKKKIDALIEQTDYMLSYLQHQPTNTMEYVEYLDYINLASAKVDTMEEDLDYCKELYDIMEEFSMLVSEEDMSNYLGVSVTMGSVRSAVDKKVEELDKISKAFQEQMNKDISSLISEVGNIKTECMQPWLLDIESNVGEVTDFLNDLHDRLLECLNNANEFKNYQRQFKLEVMRFEMLDEVMSDVKLRILLWESVVQWAKTMDDWYKAGFHSLNVDEMNMFVAKNMKNINLFEKGLPRNLIVPKLKDDVELMKNKMPVITYLRNQTLKPRHWMKIETILNYKFKPDEEMTLKLLEDLRVFKYPNELMEVSGQASSEAGLEAMLKKVEESWKALEFVVLPHKDAKDVYILGTLEEVQTVLDESNIAMATICSSRHVGPIKPRVDEWIKQLDLFTRILDEWSMCQQSWVYLEVIFSAPDIQRQLPNEAKLFTVVDKSWKSIMRTTAKMPLAMEAAMQPDMLEILQRNNQLLEQIMKCLESYLEVKRVAFPRFYFLSNDELLEILAQTRNPHAVQPHLRKCFDAIAKLEFASKITTTASDVDVSRAKSASELKKAKSAVEILTNDINAMISPEGERVELTKGLKARGNVEDWLGKVEAAMFLSLRRIMKHAILDYQERSRVDWVLIHPNQITLTVSQIMWAKGVHEILDGHGNKIKEMQDYEQTCITDLNNLAVLIRSDLPPVTRKVLIALITIDVHARDTIHNLVQSGEQSSSSFEWLKVLRYYWEENIDDCVARMSSAFYVYGYEYLGAAGVLVITPLTDRCYLCLMGALQLDLGGAPAGPAGTGKTETTKDLAKALAIQCVVFNCSEGLDYKMMGRFFSGLAQSGAWCCFDEFNRIDIEVLSVIAQQIITIRNAKAARQARFMFEGREIKLIPRCAAFITMNPGYAGRTELPDNLKALFRPISMMVPDYALIAEVILYSEGFESSKGLSQKMVQMYKLCSEQLSQQDHYDFGMRAVKSVLVMAGSLKRANPDRNEDAVLICALRDSNLPKFLADDAVLFQGILSDLFPGVELPVQDYGVFQENIIESMIQLDLQPAPTMIKKIIQLYETMVVRWGVMLVGPTGGGKTSVLNSLNLSLGKMYEQGISGPYYCPVRTYIMNPKAVTAGELYGEVNPFTMEWRDGLMGIMMRTAVASRNEDNQWIVCDGPVDAVWIENLNTVLDDNKMLCLANSERIKLTPYVHMIFEVMDLAQASPATVSRCGMVYIDPDELKWFPYVKSWAQKLDRKLINQELIDFVLILFDYAIERAFKFIRKHCDYTMHQVDISKVALVCALFTSLISMPGSMENIGERSKVRCYLCQIFIFSYIWGLGGNLSEASREKFESHVRDKFDDHQDAKLPPGSDLWNVYMNVESHRLEPWLRIIPSFVYNKEIPFFETLVPTIDTVRFGYVAERLIYVNYPVLLTGDTGVGKSVVAKNVLTKLFESGRFVPATMNFSAQTSSLRTQEILELKLERKKKTLLGAPMGKKVVVFVDDVNMPKLETYGAQPPIELLRQFLCYGGLYDREKLFWKDIQDVIIMTACAPPGGGRNPLTPRFMRHFGMLQIPAPNEFSLKAIFKAILKGFLAEFSRDVAALAEYMVNAAVEIYLRIATDLLPTPTKSHYVFNLRDLSKCIQGVLQADPGTLRDEISMLKLFYHECLRVFHDRLINTEDKSYFYFLMKEICSRNFGTPVLVLPDVPVLMNPPVLLFGDFMQLGAKKEDRIYEELQNIEKLKSVLQDYLDDYNLLASKEMNLIFFMDAIEHCVRIARILRSERGNALLVGVGGMGKQSLTRLASHLNGYTCYQIELTRNYDHASFFEDLRKMYFNAGATNEDTVFLFTDTQIVQEEFLEDINNILNTGEVPNLFESDEYEKVIIAVREKAKESGIDEGNRDGIFDYFIRRVRSNLHLVLCMSPVGDNFRRRCRMFPSLVNCCTIDWFEKWPQEALLSVAQNSFKDLAPNERILDSLSNTCVSMHVSVEVMTHRFYVEMRRYYYTTPSSYLELLKLYNGMLKKKEEQIVSTRDRIANGLKKLYETNSIIDEMKETLIALEPELAKKSIVVAELMVQVEKEQKQADKVREVVKKDEEVAKGKAEDTQLIADDAQRDLDTALPALEAAKKALESLNKNDINEIKVFQKPPKMVQFVMESVCLLLGAKTDWATAKIVLGDMKFLERLQEYDKDHISENILRKLKTYVEHPDFLPEKILKVSKACTCLCMWVRAIDMYAKTFKIVEPKRKRLEQAERELNITMSLLRDKQRQLADVEEMIANLEAKFNRTVAEQKELVDNMELTSNRLVRAGKLNIALADEQIRWEESVKQFGIELVNLFGDVLIATACVAYLGAFTDNYRMELIKLWIAQCKEAEIAISEDFSLIGVLADAFEIRIWNTYGLPRDKVSTENAILVTRAARWPLMIDPQEQANRWIRLMETDNNLKIIKQTDTYLMRVLENSIRLGMPVLLEEVGETLDPTLQPILLKQTFISGGRVLIRLGDSDVDYDSNFKLYITTKLANPHYLPEICIQVTIVNFTVTASGLEDQLLADVVSLERPDLEKLRTELVIKINDDKTQLKNIEDKILRLLYQSEGNILDDEELIDTLNESKETSAIINVRLVEAESTEQKISEAREKYRVVATRGSVLYFVVAQLGEIDPMYQYSLKYFNQIFSHVTITSEKNDNLQIRLGILLREITASVYTNVSRGLFERHKLVFSFMLCVAIYLENGEILDSEWNYLLRGPIGAKVEIEKKPNVPVITDAMWLAVNFLAVTYPEFRKLPDEILKSIDISVGDFHHKIELLAKCEPNTVNWNHELKDFSKLMLIKTLQEEKLVFAITEFVRTKLGQTFIESPQISLHTLYQDTSNAIPLIFILSSGSDPFGAFQRFAAEMGCTERIQSISLGQGQGPVAEKIIERGLERGDWVFLQNCHLATSWMLAMERIIIKIAEDAKRVNQNFRLYMSSMPSKAFPVSVLQNSVKVTNEPPKGLRANVRRAFAEMTDEFFNDHPLENEWRKMLFGICMFHAIIQERKKFGPLGWNIVYEFNNSDRDFAFNTLRMFCAEGTIPWDALEYLTGEITYGGRVTDNWDLRCLRTILKIFFAPHTLQKNYKYSESGIYYSPEFETLKEYQDFIDATFPILEEPEIFGMHENANIAYQIKETQNVILTIVESQPRASGGAEGVSSDEIVYGIAVTITEEIIPKIDTTDINARMFKRDDKDRLPSLTTVLLQEIDRYDKLLRLIHSSLDNLKKAIKGLVVMSEALEEVFKAFMNNQVPKMWSARSYNSLKSLGSWVHDLTLRIDFIFNWVKFGPPVSYWLPGFYFPQGFLTGTLQTHARRYNLPIDELKFDFEVKTITIDQENVKKFHDDAVENQEVYLNIQAPDDGVIIHGLFLDAGRWDNNLKILVDANPGEINPPLPAVWFNPKLQMPHNEARYVTPLYKTSVRAGVLSTTGHSTNFVIAVLLPSRREQAYWILKGTALLTQITD